MELLELFGILETYRNYKLVNETFLDDCLRLLNKIKIFGNVINVSKNLNYFSVCEEF